MTSIWAIERGEYSDYHVVGVFSSKANALRFGSEDEIVEWHLDPGIAEANAGLHWYRVEMDVTGDNGVAHIIKSLPDYMDEGFYRNIFGGTKWNRGRIWTYLYARDEQHAIKICNERRLHWRLGEEGED